LEAAVNLEKFMQDRMALAKKWRGQMIASIIILLLGFLSVEYLLHNPNPQVVLAIVAFVAIVGFVLRKKYRLILGITEIVVALVTAWNVVSTAPPLGDKLFDLSDPKHVELMYKVVGAVYLMIRGIEDMWESGAILESLKLGILGPFIEKPGYVVVPHADEARDPVSVKDLTQYALVEFREWLIGLEARLHHPRVLFSLFIDVLGSAIWRSTGMAVLVASVVEAVVWSFLHDKPNWVIVGIVFLGLIGLLAFARWIGDRRIFCGLWLLFVSLGFMTGLIIIGLSVDPLSLTGVLLGFLIMILCWHPLKGAEDRRKAMETAEQGTITSRD
jgi:hypothetical protein